MGNKWDTQPANYFTTKILSKFVSFISSLGGFPGGKFMYCGKLCNKFVWSFCAEKEIGLKNVSLRLSFIVDYYSKELWGTVSRVEENKFYNTGRICKNPP